MKEIPVGEAVKRRREELGLTQEQVCLGICDSCTMSRLENHRQMPSHRTLVAILQRLGMPEDRYYALLSDREVELERMENEIVRSDVRFERAAGEDRSALREEALKTLAELERLAGPEDRLARQLVLSSQVLLGGPEGRWPLDQSIPVLLEAIRLTAPRFDPEDPGRGPYTDREMQIINQMAQEYIFAGKYAEAAGLLDQLLRYAQGHLRDIPPVRARIPLICHNYAIALAYLQRYEDALKIAELGREVCVVSVSCQHLPGLLAILAECRHHLGNDEESERLFRQAYYLYKALENESDLACLIEDAKKCLGIDLR